MMKCLANNKSLYKKLKKTTVDHTVEFMLIAFATYLGDKRGWKPHRIHEALKWINKFASMISEDYLTLEDAIQSLEEEYGLIFTKSGDVYYNKDYNKKETNHVQSSNKVIKP